MAGNRGVAFVAGAVIGVLTGGMTAWGLGLGPHPRAAAAKAASPPAPQPATSPAPVAHSAPGARPAVAVAPRSGADDAAALRACRAALAEVNARAGKAAKTLHAEGGQIAEAKAIQAEDEGTPLQPPKGMPSRLMDPKYARKEVKALFDTVGGGEVTSVDCTEFPCLVYGDVSRNDPQALGKANMGLQGASVGGDDWSACSREEYMGRHGSSHTIHYAYAVCPKGYRMHMTSAEQHRIAWRFRQMMQADMGR